MGAPDHCVDVNVHSHRGAAAAERISAKMGTSEHYMGGNTCGLLLLQELCQALGTILLMEGIHGSMSQYAGVIVLQHTASHVS